MSRPPAGDDPIGPLRAALVERRQALGLGQRAVAARMNVSQSVLSELETGSTVSPGIDTLMRWARAVDGELEFTLSLAAVTIPARRQRIAFPGQP